MIVKGQNYNPPTQYLFLDEKRKLGIVKRIRKQITKLDITNEDLVFVTN
jgi:transposase